VERFGERAALLSQTVRGDGAVFPQPLTQTIGRETMSLEEKMMIQERARNRATWVNPAIVLMVLNLAAVLVYFFVALRYNYLANVGRLVFASPDAEKYRDIGDWLLGKSNGVPTAAVLFPFFYPLLVGTIRSITHNAYVIWVTQFVFWLAAVNLISASVYLLTKRRLLAVIAFGVMMLNVSLIVLTFYALTEATVVFLLSLWTFALARLGAANWSFKHVLILTFLLSMLAVVKPVFEIPLLIFVAYVLIFRPGRIKNGFCILLALFPVYIQFFIMVNAFNVFGLAQVGDVTVRRYFLSQVYSARENVSLDTARSWVEHYSNAQVVSYALSNPTTSFSVYVQNLIGNMTGGPLFTETFPKPYVFGRLTNAVYLVIHFLLLVPMCYIILVKRKAPVSITLLYIFVLVIFLTSGISANEGDRLIATALPLWMAAYLSAFAMVLPQSSVKESRA
jgi:hypothetical protein